MKKFHFKGEMKFEAEDIHDALAKMSEHFKELSTGKATSILSKGSDYVVTVNDETE